MSFGQRVLQLLLPMGQWGCLYLWDTPHPNPEGCTVLPLPHTLSTEKVLPWIFYRRAELICHSSQLFSRIEETVEISPESPCCLWWSLSELQVASIPRGPWGGLTFLDPSLCRGDKIQFSPMSRILLSSVFKSWPLGWPPETWERRHITSLSLGHNFSFTLSQAVWQAPEEALHRCIGYLVLRGKLGYTVNTQPEADSLTLRKPNILSSLPRFCT